MYNIPHVEDLVFNGETPGYAGSTSIICALYEMVNHLSGSSISSELNIKWDGSPSIICGYDSKLNFFVGTKSVFNKIPKFNYSFEDIDRNHPNAGLNSVLKIALTYLPELDFTGIMQGDLLYVNHLDHSILEENSDCVAFKPNTIKYAIPKKSTLYEQIVNSKIGIIWHTRYFDLKVPRYDNIPVIESTKNVWCRDASITIPNDFITEDEQKALVDMIEEIDQLYSNVPLSVYKRIGESQKIREYIKDYINDCVRRNNTPSAYFLSEYVIAKTSKHIWDAKKLETKANRVLEQKELMKFFVKKERQIDHLFVAWNKIQEFKQIFIEKVSRLDNGFRMFLETEYGPRKTTHEGFVLTDRYSNDIVKIINRNEFSRANFANMKE